MATYTEVQNFILGDLHRTDLTTQVQTAMSNAVDKLRLERFWFNESQTSFTATLTSDYAISTVLPRLLQIDTMRVWHNGTPTELDRGHWADFNTLDETLVNGTPSYWAVHHQMLRLYPTPNETMSVEASGLLELSLTAWCSYAPTVVRALAEVELFSLVTHDQGGAARVADFLKLEIEQLRKRGATMATSGEVRGYL